MKFIHSSIINVVLLMTMHAYTAQAPVPPEITEHAQDSNPESATHSIAQPEKPLLPKKQSWNIRAWAAGAVGVFSACAFCALRSRNRHAARPSPGTDTPPQGSAAPTQSTGSSNNLPPGNPKGLQIIAPSSLTTTDNATNSQLSSAAASSNTLALATAAANTMTEPMLYLAKTKLRELSEAADLATTLLSLGFTRTEIDFVNLYGVGPSNYLRSRSLAHIKASAAMHDRQAKHNPSCTKSLNYLGLQANTSMHYKHLTEQDKSQIFYPAELLYINNQIEQDQNTENTPIHLLKLECEEHLYATILNPYLTRSVKSSIPQYLRYLLPPQEISS